MTIIEGADLKLSLTIYTDDEKDLPAFLQMVKNDIRHGKLANDFVCCNGSYQFKVEEQSRTAEQRNEAASPALELLRRVRNNRQVVNVLHPDVLKEMDAVLESAG